MNYIAVAISVLSFCISCFSAFLAYRAFRGSHDWNRRHFATQLMERWNTETARHRQAIEKAFPGVVDTDKNKQSNKEIPENRAREIYLSKPNEGDDWQLRFHMVELLNYFEFISVSYENHVGDRRIIERSFQNPLVRWQKILNHFIEVVELHRGYEPWEPYKKLMNYWNSVKFEDRKPTDTIFKW